MILMIILAFATTDAHGGNQACLALKFILLDEEE